MIRYAPNQTQLTPSTGTNDVPGPDLTRLPAARLLDAKASLAVRQSLASVVGRLSLIDPDDPASEGFAACTCATCPLNARAQSAPDLPPVQVVLDHVTPFGARVPAPIAVPPRRSAPPSLKLLACLWLAAFLSVSTAAWLTMDALNDLDRRLAGEARI